MTIERYEKAHWFAKPTVREMDPDESEVLVKSHDLQKTLVVDNADQVVVEHSRLDKGNIFMVTSRKRFYKNELNSEVGQDATYNYRFLDVFVGRSVLYRWRPTVSSVKIKDGSL